MKVKADEIELGFDDICEKIFVIPKYDKDKSNAAIKRKSMRSLKKLISK